MSTRSRIGIEAKDGSIRSIYCHFDGYPEGVGATLAKHYADETALRSLLALGDISSLGAKSGKPDGHSFDSPNPGYTVAYGRDRNETGTEARACATRTEFVEMARKSGGEYAYLLTAKGWRYTKLYGGKAVRFSALPKSALGAAVAS